MRPEADHPRDTLLRRPRPQSHMVLFYGTDDKLLAHNAGRYLFEGLKVGDGLLVIGVPEHNCAIAHELNRLGADVDASVREGRICFLDAEEMLGEFMVGGQPYWGHFEMAVGGSIREIRTRVGHGGLRAYGEMVGVLWNAGQHSAAIRLEQFWNKLLSRCSASLFCGYPIDIFAKEFQIGAVDALLCAHTHLIPAGSNGDLEAAVNRAMDSVLGAEAHAIRSTVDAKPAWAGMPKAEATMLWVRENLPGCADDILARAREFYQPAC
jgi:hypothetical protein